MNFAFAQTVAKTAATAPVGPQNPLMSLFMTTILPIMLLYYFFFVYLPAKDKKEGRIPQRHPKGRPGLDPRWNIWNGGRY